MIWYSLRNKLVVPTLALFVLGLGLSSRLTYTVCRNALTASVNEQMDQLSESTMKSIASWVGERRREIVVWTERPSLSDALTPGENVLEARKKASAYLERFHADAPYYEDLLLADPNGELVSGSRAQNVAVNNVADRDYFKRAMKGEVVVSNVLKSRTSGNPVFVVAAPVLTNGVPVGVFLGSVHLTYFTRNFIDPVKIGPSGYAFVTDRAGFICAHPDVSMILKTNMADFVFGKEMIEKKNGKLTYVFQGATVLSAYKTDPTFGWMVVVRALQKEVMASAEEIQRDNLVVGGIAVVITAFFLLLLSRGVSRSIGGIAHVAGLIAQGNLAEAKQAVRARGRTRRWGRDETDNLFESVATMTDSLSSLVGQVQHSSVQLASTATEIAATSRQQESVVANFGSSTTEVFATVQQISATSQDLAKTVQEVKEVTTATADLADTGRTGLAEMESVMGHLADATMSIANKLAIISEKASNINSVITTITKVADQTNLLSLNASIEAEKAGQYGLGFAVVAREIRRLADQTAVATLDIERMVKEMQSAVSSGVMEVDKFSGSVTRGVGSVEEINRQLTHIIAQIKELAPRFVLVNEGVRAQSQGAGQISHAVSQLNEGAKKTAESLGQFNQATEQLREAARHLQTEVTQFKV